MERTVRKQLDRRDRSSRRVCSASGSDKRSSSPSSSMLFDMDMGGSASENEAQSTLMPDLVPENAQLQTADRAGCSRSVDVVEYLSEEVELLLLSDQENGALSALDLARLLALKGYHSNVMMERSRYCKHTVKGPVVPFRPFLLVTGYSSSDGVFTDLHVIVDPGFRAKFQIAQPSPKYAAVLNELREAFVGEPDAMKTLVTRLSGALKKEFMDKGMSLPPWRSAVSLLSIWFPLDGRRFMCVTPDETL